MTALSSIGVTGREEYVAGGSCPNYTKRQTVDPGTSCVAETPPPQPLGLCPVTKSAFPDSSWGYGDVLVWKVLPKWLGGNPDLLRNYKDTWVRAHRALIMSLSAQYQLPPELLAGVAWIEAGGKPYSSKILVYDVRAFDHLADPLLEPLTITKKPGLTSMGPVAIQLRRAAETMGLDFDGLTLEDRNRLVECLQVDENDLAIVARHLWQLKQIDFPDRAVIGLYEIRIIGARYNRGPDLSLDVILRDTSYGDFIVNRIYTRLQKLLME
jgi:hypothetical protein